MSHTSSTLPVPRALDDSLIGANSKLAIEKGLAEADWYQCKVPRATMRTLLERRDGPALRNTALWFGLMLCKRFPDLAALAYVTGRAALYHL